MEVDGKVSISITNELSVPVQLRYYWKGELVEKPLATIMPGKSKSMSTWLSYSPAASGWISYRCASAGTCTCPHSRA